MARLTVIPFMEVRELRSAEKIWTGFSNLWISLRINPLPSPFTRDKAIQEVTSSNERIQKELRTGNCLY